MQYQEKTLNSGRVVSIRPLSWGEFWELGEKRLSAQNKVAQAAQEEKSYDNELRALHEMRILREQPLRWCVQDFDTLSAECSVAEITEIEMLINSLSERSVREGNLSPAAAPTAATA